MMTRQAAAGWEAHVEDKSHAITWWQAREEVLHASLAWP